MKRQKTLQKEAEQLSRRGREGEGERPAWRDEESDPEEEGVAMKVPSMPASGYDHYSKSVSPDPDLDGRVYVSSLLEMCVCTCVCIYMWSLYGMELKCGCVWVFGVESTRRVRAAI